MSLLIINKYVLILNLDNVLCMQTFSIKPNATINLCYLHSSFFLPKTLALSYNFLTGKSVFNIILDFLMIRFYFRAHSPTMTDKFRTFKMLNNISE